MRLEEIDIGKTEESKRNAIRTYVGRQAILYDEHEKLNHALLMREDDIRSYEVKFGDGRRPRILHYNDLQKLIILSPIGNNTLPQINPERKFNKTPIKVADLRNHKRFLREIIH